MGQVSEIKLPTITLKKEDYRVGFTSVPITLGLEPLETEITMVEQVKEMFLLFGVLGASGAGTLVSFKGYQEGAGLVSSNEIEIQMRGHFHELDLGTAKRGEMPSNVIKVGLEDFVYKQDGVPLITVNGLTNTLMIGTTDKMLKAKKALGFI